MSKPLRIPTAFPSDWLEFSSREVSSSGSFDFYSVTVSSTGLKASLRIDAYWEDGLIEFFNEIARDWKGWIGKKEWESIERSLALSAIADRAGHTYLTVELQVPDIDGWYARAVLTLEAGQLEQIARDVERFFRPFSRPK
jgi:hypothetical protein